MQNMEIIERQEEIVECTREVGVYSVVASLVPRRLSVGRELEAFKMAVVREGVPCGASARGDPVRSTCPRSVQPVFRLQT